MKNWWRPDEEMMKNWWRPEFNAYQVILGNTFGLFQEKYVWSKLVRGLSVLLSSLEIFLRKQFLEIHIEHVSTGYLQLYTFADKNLTFELDLE